AERPGREPPSFESSLDVRLGNVLGSRVPPKRLWNRAHVGLHHDTAIRRRTPKERRPTRPSDCNGGLARRTLSSVRRSWRAALAALSFRTLPPVPVSRCDDGTRDSGANEA